MTTNTQKKIGLVVEGGGMKCAYNAGILDAFLDEGITFDYCIGVSGGSGNLASYLAGQRGRNLRFFTEHIHSQNYFGLRSLLKTGDLFGLKYIYGELTRKEGEDPLDFPALMNNPAEYEIVVTNALTGLPEYYGREMMAQDDYRLIMASSAIPVACHPVELNGVPTLTEALPMPSRFAAPWSRGVISWWSFSPRTGTMYESLRVCAGCIGGPAAVTPTLWMLLIVAM